MLNRHAVHHCKCCLEDLDLTEYTMPCQSMICGDCCQKYLIILIDQDFQIDQDIKCPDIECKKPHNIYQFRQHALGDKQYNIPRQSELDDKLLIKHLQNEQLARNCPNAKCKYFCLLPQNVKQCKNLILKCEICNTEWQDILIQQQTLTFLQKVQKIVFQKNEFFSELYKIFMTKRCPKCKIHITKYGGCPHMICRQCNFQYCWYCCQTYQTHTLFKYNSVFLISALLIIYYTGIYKYIWNLFLSIIFFIINACIQNLLIFFFILFSSFLKQVWGISRQIAQRGYNKQLLDQKKKHFHLSIATGFLFFAFLILILQYQYTIKGLLKFAILEFIIFAIIYISYSTVQFLWQTWIKFIY